MKSTGKTGFLLLILINILMVCRFCSVTSELAFTACASIKIFFILHVAELGKIPYKTNSLHIQCIYLRIQCIYLAVDQSLKPDKCVTFEVKKYLVS